MTRNVYPSQTCIVCRQHKPPEAFARPAGRPPRKRCKECNDTILANQGDGGIVEASADPAFLRRFWRKVDIRGPDECWLWKGTLHGINGYGSIGRKARNMRVHRLSYFLHNGRLPKDLCVCHRCDRKPCVNPNHLFLGTIADNTRDRDRKHRVQHGENHYRTKLTPDQIRAIRASKMTTTALARKYGVVTSHICRIKQRQTWKRLD